MIINIENGTASQKKYIESMIQFCIKKMMPRIKGLEIDVILKDMTKDGVYGFCMADPNSEADRSDRPRCFELTIHRKLPLRKLLETIAHEMVHVKQYARGELYQGSRVNKHRWQGSWLNTDPDYWDQPWEIEAHGREVGLFVRWAESEGLANKKWTWD